MPKAVIVWGRRRVPALARPRPAFSVGLGKTARDRPFGALACQQQLQPTIERARVRFPTKQELDTDEKHRRATLPVRSALVAPSAIARQRRLDLSSHDAKTRARLRRPVHRPPSPHLRMVGRPLQGQPSRQSGAVFRRSGKRTIKMPLTSLLTDFKVTKTMHSRLFPCALG